MDMDTFEDYDFVGSSENFHSVNEDRSLCRPISQLFNALPACNVSSADN